MLEAVLRDIFWFAVGFLVALCVLRPTNGRAGRIGLACALMLAGCAMPQEATDEDGTPVPREGVWVPSARWVDEELGVACYRWHGISCVKLADEEGPLTHDGWHIARGGPDGT